MGEGARMINDIIKLYSFGFTSGVLLSGIPFMIGSVINIIIKIFKEA